MNNKTDVAIIGAGPAGLTAAIYLIRAGFSVKIFEGKAVGGQIINAQAIDNYPGMMGVSGAELAMKMEAQAEELGAEIIDEQVVSISGSAGEFTVQTENGAYTAAAVVLATGAAVRKLGIAREAELTGKGVSYCATCDGNFYRGKDVVVVGGGNTALDDALYLAGICHKVYLVHRREEFRGDESTVQKLEKQSNVEFVLKANVVELLGEDKIEGVRVRFDDGNERTLAAAGVFFAIGYEPVAKNIQMDVALDAEGYVETADGAHTNVAGIYVAGDTRKKVLKQLVTAMSDGAMVADLIRREMG